MNGFLESFLPILEGFKKYKVEAFLLSTASIITLISALIFVSNLGNQQGFKNKTVAEVEIKPKLDAIYVELAGAIERPNVYEVTNGARLKDALILAGGLTASADRSYFSRNFNLAEILGDQEKIYIPTTVEVEEGVSGIPNAISNLSQPARINLNSASLQELDTLPGVGEATGNKIIQGRPYKSPDELLSKKIVGQSLYDKIKDLIALD